MDVDALLCNHAEVSEGKLYVNGGCVNVFTAGPEAPYLVTFSLAVIVHIPYTETDRQHTIAVALHGADGPVAAWTPEGMPGLGPVRMEGSFNVGRGPMLRDGDVQDVPFAFAITQLPLREPGAYSFHTEVDGTQAHIAAFRVTQPTPPPEPPQARGSGPTAIPPFRPL